MKRIAINLATGQREIIKMTEAEEQARLAESAEAEEKMAQQAALERELTLARLEADLAAAKVAGLGLAQAEIEGQIAGLSEVRP